MSESVTNSSSKIIIISNVEIFHLFTTLSLFVGLIFVLVIAYGMFQNISNDCRLKALLIGGKDQQMSHMFVITIIASEPSLAYDYDNSSIRIDLNDRKNESIASLLIRPLWAFHSIQPKPNSTPTWKTPEDNINDNSDTLEKVNLSRQVPLIGIYKMVADKNLKPVQTILLGHDCPHPDASILVRCVEISNLTSLVSHTYPLNAYIPHLSQPIGFLFSASKRVFEFDSSEDILLKTQYEHGSSLNHIETGSLWLLSFNLISVTSYFWSQTYEYEYSEEWLMWYKALLLSLIIGSLAAVFHLILSLLYRTFKEYNLFNQTNRVIFLKRLFLWIVLLISLILLMTSIAAAKRSIRSTIFFRWYRIAFLSLLVFIGLSLGLNFFNVFAHIKPKLRNENSFDSSTLEIPKNGEKMKKYQMIVQSCTAIHINNLKCETIFASPWLQSALSQHQGLNRAILCDVYDVNLLPDGEVTTSLAKNVVQLFGEVNAKDRSAVYATRMIEQKGMVVSVSQYGHKKKATKPKEKVVDNIENNDK